MRVGERRFGSGEVGGTVDYIVIHVYQYMNMYIYADNTIVGTTRCACVSPDRVVQLYGRTVMCRVDASRYGV